MKYQHKIQAKGEWRKKSLAEQMANIGSEIERSIKWLNKNKEYSELAFYRAIELFNLSICDPKNKNRLKEIIRAQEIFSDDYLNNKLDQKNKKSWQNYFMGFNYLVCKNK